MTECSRPHARYTSGRSARGSGRSLRSAGSTRPERVTSSAGAWLAGCPPTSTLHVGPGQRARGAASARRALNGT